MARSIIPMAAESPVEFYNNMLDSFFGIPRQNAMARSTFRVDVEETENGYVVTADLPGVKKDELDIEMNEEKLIIAVKVDEEKEVEEKNYIHRERYRCSMARGAHLKDADPEAITAKLEDGVLTVVVPKKAPVSNVRKISLA